MSSTIVDQFKKALDTIVTSRTHGVHDSTPCLHAEDSISKVLEVKAPQPQEVSPQVEYIASQPRAEFIASQPQVQSFQTSGVQTAPQSIVPQFRFMKSNSCLFLSFGIVICILIFCYKNRILSYFSASDCNEGVERLDQLKRSDYSSNFLKNGNDHLEHIPEGTLQKLLNVKPQNKTQHSMTGAVRKPENDFAPSTVMASETERNFQTDGTIENEDPEFVPI